MIPSLIAASERLRIAARAATDAGRPDVAEQIRVAAHEVWQALHAAQQERQAVAQ